jgi:cystathionine beta-lyase/cystathionine gamma-synthase
VSPRPGAAGRAGWQPGYMTPGEHTRAVHRPPAPVFPQRPLGLPVHRTAAFAFRSSQEYADVLGGRAPGYSYGRVDNPTSDAFAQAVAALEGAGVDGEVVGQPFASGMAAITTVLMQLTRAGAHVVAPREIYGGTYGLLVNQLARFGVQTSFVDTTDPEEVRAAVRPGATTVVYAETLANPTMTVADLPGLATVAREAGVALVVDSTFASPAVCRPLEHGADVVVHSATKYLGGHSDATGGVAVGAPDLLARVRAGRIDLGGTLAPDEAFLLHRGLATLPLRVDRACRTALAVATALADHPAVLRVDHPGLPTSRSHDLARKLFDEGRYGAVLTVTPRGGRAAGMALGDRLRLVALATSLGGTSSKAGHVASTTHRQLDDAALAAAGIDPGAVRVSVGLEDAEDLVADLVQALDGL